jgi:thiamine-phosphate pyrophosphorylase
MGSTNTGTANALEVLEAALRGGITCFQLREKGPNALTGIKKLAFALQCQTLCAKYNTPFIVNDDINLAIAVDADGVHIGQEDELASVVRQKIGATKILGVSTHTNDEVEKAIAAGADYVGIGPIYATNSKTNAKPVAGTAFLRHTHERFPDLPIVGIGGITIDNAAPVIEAGASGVSVISAIAASADPYLKAVEFRQVVENQLGKGVIS